YLTIRNYFVFATMTRFVSFCLLFSLLPHVYGQNRYVVDTDEVGNSPSNGTLTLDMAIGLVNGGSGGDTILIDYTGTYSPIATLTISQSCIILGPAPSRFSIDGSGVTSGSVFDIASAGT